MNLKGNYRKIIVLILAIGILLCGLGTGVAISEYSSFEYLGQKNLGGDELKTDTFQETLYRGKNGNGEVYIHSYGLGEEKISLETSKKVPKDQIQFVVEYNPNNVQDIHIDKGDSSEYNEYAEDAEYPQEIEYVTYYLSPVMSEHDQFGMMMSYKDEILENLKEKRFYEYDYKTIQSVRVVVHPSNKDVVKTY